MGDKMKKSRITCNKSVGLFFGLRLVFLLVSLLAFTAFGYGQIFGEPSFGRAEPDIDTQVKYDEGIILFNFDLDKNHHITDIKNEFFKIELDKNDYLEIIDVVFPRGVPYADEMVYKGQFTVKVYVKSLKAVTDAVKLKFKVSYQICQEHPTEVCFAPEEKEYELTINQAFKEAKIVEKVDTPSPPSTTTLEDLSAKTSAAALKPKGGNWLVLLVVALLLLAFSVFVGLSRALTEDDMGAKFLKAIVILLFLVGTFLLLKSLDIKYYPNKYQEEPEKTVTLNWIHNLDEGKAVAQKENKRLLIDTYADWCIACKELDRYTFSRPEVAEVLKDYVLVKLDFTKGTAENKKLQSDLKVMGLPTVMLLSPEGSELRRFIGFKNKSEFLDFLKAGEGWLERFLKLLKQELENKSLLLFGLVFLLGFLASLTPCVYPVIPIVMGYIGTRSGKKKLKGFYLSIFFVLGLAFVYSLLGVIAAMAGSIIGVTFQNPIVVLIISGIFIVMGLSLAGLFEIPIPTSISSKVQSGSKKSEIISSLVVGGVAGIIAAPCAGPVLVTLLSWISQTRDVLLGFLLTFIFSMGMGIIFLVVGTFSGVVSTMPKGGKWMDYVKYFFSVILMAGGVYILTTIAPGWVSLLLWGVLLISVSVFIGLFKALEEYKIKNKIYKLIVLLIFLVGIFLFYKSLELKFFTTSASPPAEKTIEQTV